MSLRLLDLSPNQQIAAHIKAVRRQTGWSQATLAAKAGLTQAAIAKLESGAANPTVGTLDKLAQVLPKPFAIKFARR